jgi:SAM-dependent methyltransferase
MSVLLRGGKATITLGLVEAVPNGRVVGVDLDKDSLLAARCSAVLIGRKNLACILANGRQLPFHDAAFDAVLCHSMLETLDDPANVMAELRRVTKHGGVVGAASVDYGGLFSAAIRQPAHALRHPPTSLADRGIAGRIWSPAAGFSEAGSGIEAFADYVATDARSGRDLCRPATECQDQGCRLLPHAMGSRRSTSAHLAAAWEVERTPGPRLAWCRVLAWLAAGKSGMPPSTRPRRCSVARQWRLRAEEPFPLPRPNGRCQIQRSLCCGEI